MMPLPVDFSELHVEVKDPGVLYFIDLLILDIVKMQHECHGLILTKNSQILQEVYLETSVI